VFSNDGLTLKAPFPFCHSKAISFSPSQREELASVSARLPPAATSGEGDQQMDVVGCATCGEDFDVKIFCNASR
jgi:hypothetical protein